MKYRKRMIQFFWISVIVCMVGYFLWTILIPIQDVHLLTNEELRQAQRELALNYQLGRILLFVGIPSVVISFVYLFCDGCKVLHNKFKK